jgi:hypothetical protein
VAGPFVRGDSIGARLKRSSGQSAERCGLWAADGHEGARFWLQVLTELKNRGVAGSAATSSIVSAMV